MNSALARFRPPRTATRYVVLIVVILLFLVLLGLGVWLASHLHSTQVNSQGASLTARALGWSVT